MSLVEYTLIALGGLLTAAIFVPALLIIAYDWWENR